jgi:nucleoside 2-deoxyribosyltransferase
MRAKLISNNVLNLHLGLTDHLVKDKKVLYFDAFIAAPLSGVKSESELIDIKKEIYRLQNLLAAEFNFENIFYAGSNINSKTDFDSPKESALNDLGSINNTKLFILVYPYETLTSALIEVGYAIALKKRTIIFTKSRGELPYLLKEVDLAYSFVKIYEYQGSLSTSFKENRFQIRTFLGNSIL